MTEASKQQQQQQQQQQPPNRSRRGRSGGGRGRSRGGGTEGGFGRGGGRRRYNDGNHAGDEPPGGGFGRGRGRGRQKGRGRGRSEGPTFQRGSGRGWSNENAGRSSTGNGRGGRGGARGGQTSGSTVANNSSSGRGPRIPAKKSSGSSPPPLKGLQNGQKGADASTVGEADRIQFTQILLNLRENEQLEKLDFPETLTNTERKFVHELSAQLNLVSKSSGKGDQRRITVSKRSGTKSTTSNETNEAIPQLLIGDKGIQRLKQHTLKFPPTHAEELESKSTGASLLEALKQQQQQQQDSTTSDNNTVTMTTALEQLGVTTPTQDSERYNNKGRRLASQKQRLQKEKRWMESHKRSQSRKSNNNDYKKRMAFRSTLPAFAHEAQIVKSIQDHAVTIIAGETGCGKSTQVPQFLLDAFPTASICCTQPRRISAFSLAERVAYEQCESVGSRIGYQVRLESALSEDTQLLFVTPGILLRKLHTSPQLQEYTHVVIDEIHEKDKYTEFLLIVLRDLLPQRPELRVILMSATLDTEALLSYFDTTTTATNVTTPPALVQMEGRTFPVQAFYLEDILRMTNYIDMADFVVDDDSNGTTKDKDAIDEKTQFMEAELAKLLRAQDPSAFHIKTKVLNGCTNSDKLGSNSGLKCDLCGQEGFVDADELGSHLFLCDGTVHATGRTPSSNNDAEFEEYKIDEFEDYDVDEDSNDSRSGQLEEPEKSEEAKTALSWDKWDGTSPFKFMNSNDGNDDANSVTPTLTATDEEILKRYQTMHDDEEVDMDLLLDVLHYLIKSSHGDGAILVFLPGWQEIAEFSMLLQNTTPFRDRSMYLILPLHSGIPSKDQRKVLQRPPKGIRKIVLSTNIAETSLTIDDVAFVVDSGRAKEKNYDPHLKTSTLQPMWISQASAKQRRGRAGRTKAGVCFHMFSKRRYASLRPFVESELLRTPLEEICLMTKKLNLAPGGPEDDDGVPAFLAKAICPPHSKSVSNALDLLVELGAMQPETNDLTDLGRCLSVLSLEPRVGKMVIWSYLLGCTRAASGMAVAMSYKSPFVLPPQSMRRAADNAKVQLSRNSESDQVTVLYAIQKRDELKDGSFQQFCRDNFLNSSSMTMISDLRKSLARELETLGFQAPSSSNGYHNRHENDQALWQAAIAAGLYPNIAFRKQGNTNFFTMSKQKAKIHVSSVNAVRGQPLNSKSQVQEGIPEFVCFAEMIRGKSAFTLNQTTHLVSPIPLLLLCGTSLSVRPHPKTPQSSIVSVDDWIVFQCDAAIASNLVILRKRIELAFQHAVSTPSQGLPQLANSLRDAIDTMGVVIQSAHRTAPGRIS